jgi:threonine dehydrogenase-like Zn-dependent dehydrogenase
MAHGITPRVRYSVFVFRGLSSGRLRSETFIEATGTDVPDQWKAGMEVLVSPYTSCGTCTACRQGRFNCCRNNQTLGVQRHGTMCEYFTLPYNKLFTSTTLTVQEMALVEPVTIGYHAIKRGRVTPDDFVAIFGCGAIGLGAIASTAYIGADVIAIDVDDAKLDLAAACGAQRRVNTVSDDLHQMLQSMTDGNGPDVVIEAVGLPQTYRAAVDEVCFAGRVVYIGYAKAPVEYESKNFILKELDILGSRNAFPSDFNDVIPMLESGAFPSDQIISRTVPFEEAGNALRQWHEDPASLTKIQVEFPEAQ